MFSGECLVAFGVCAVLVFPEVTAMKHTTEKPRQCYRRHPDYRWKSGDMPGFPDKSTTIDKENPNYGLHCSMRVDPGDPSTKAIDLKMCALENCTDAETTCVRNMKIQEKNDSMMVILEGCAPPPKEVPDMDEKNEYGMAGKLWEEYCENLLINHMRPVYKINAYKCYCPNHRDDEHLPCNRAKSLQTDRLSTALFFTFSFVLFRSFV